MAAFSLNTFRLFCFDFDFRMIDQSNQNWNVLEMQSFFTFTIIFWLVNS